MQIGQLDFVIGVSEFSRGDINNLPTFLYKLYTGSSSFALLNGNLANCKI